MSRGNGTGEGPTWADVATMVGDWEAHLGVCIYVQLAWREGLTSGAWAEIIIREGRVIGMGEELSRMRAAFPTRKATGQAGAVMNAIAQAIRELEANPWTWSAMMRRRVNPKP